jgi:MFS family permease
MTREDQTDPAASAPGASQSALPEALRTNPDPPAAPAASSALLIVWLVVFIDLLGFGIVLPVMPRQATVYLQETEPAVRGTVIGVLFASFSLMQFVFAPAWGRWSDRVGRRPVLLVSLTGSVLFYALYAVAVSLPVEAGHWALALMLLSRIGAGMAGASVGVAAAVIADCTPPEKRARGMALIGIAFGAGFTFGPLIAYAGLALFARQGWGVGALAAALSALALLLALLRMPETRRGRPEPRPFFSWRRTRSVLAQPAVGPLILAYGLCITAFAQLEATLALLTAVAFGLDDQQNFLVFATVGAVLLLAGGAYRALTRRWREERLLRLGLILLVLGLLGVGLVAAQSGDTPPTVTLGKLTTFYLVMILAVSGFACINPSINALVSRRTEATHQGEVLGVNQGCAALARIAGPFLGSLLFPLTVQPVLPYLSAVLLVLLAAGLVLKALAQQSAGGWATPWPAAVGMGARSQPPSPSLPSASDASGS